MEECLATFANSARRVLCFAFGFLSAPRRGRRSSIGSGFQQSTSPLVFCAADFPTKSHQPCGLVAESKLCARQNVLSVSFVVMECIFLDAFSALRDGYLFREEAYSSPP